MKNSKKRGFTIVELVIVIAVIAILAGVLIPTFTSVIKKANEASDTALIKSLNTSLKTDEVLTSKPATMHDALQVVKNDGYDLTKIKATASGNEILWDSVNNCFVYLKDNQVTYIPDSYDQEQSGVALWKIVAASETLSETYSNYLADGRTGSIEVKTGVDVGENTGITEVSYVGKASSQDVVIRTNGGALTVNAPLDSVNHYGKVVSATIIDVAPHSYYENGIVHAGIFVTKGHVVVNASKNNEVYVPSIVIKGADVQIESDNSTTVTVDGSVTVSEKTVVNGVNGSQTADFESKIAQVEVVGSESDLAAAFNKGGLYTLGGNIDLNQDLLIESGKSLTIDLNGHTISYVGAEISRGVINIANGASLTINDSVSSGAIKSQKAMCAIAVTKKDYYDATKVAKLTINGGLIEGTYYAVSGNGTRHNTEITINGGTIKSSKTAVYHPQIGNLTINGGSVEGGLTAIEVRSGSLVVNGGTFTSTAAEFTCTPNGNGATTSGAALSIVQHTTENKISVTINGGVYYGVYAIAMNDIQGNNTTNVSVQIKLGVFNGRIENTATNWTLYR